MASDYRLNIIRFIDVVWYIIMVLKVKDLALEGG